MGRMRTMTEHSRMVRGVICTLLGGCCWGFSGSCGQFLFSRYGVDPAWLTVMRMVGAGSMVTVYLLLRHRDRIRVLLHEKRDLLTLVVYALAGLLFSQYTYLAAIEYTNAGTATVLQYIGPVMLMVLVCLWDRRLPDRREVLSILLVLAGTFLIATHGDPGSMVISSKGLFWGLLSALSLVFYTLLPKPIIPKYGAVMVTGLGTFVGGVVFLVLYRPWPLLIDLDLPGILALGGMVICGTLMAHPLYLQGVNDIGPVKASMLASVEPVAATVLSVVWLKSDFVFMDFIGFVCIIATVFLLAQADSEKAPPDAVESAGDTL